MKTLLTSWICVALLLGSTANAQQVPAKPLAIQQYENVWSETNSEARLKMIQAFWLEESTYIDPAATVKGPVALNQMIENFVKMFPGSIVEGDPILSKDNYLTWNWRIFTAKKTLMVAGRDYAELDGKGHILKLVGFWEPSNPEYTNKTAVSTYFECLFKTRDFKTMATVIAKEAVYYQAEGLPYGGTFTGFENWTKMYTHAGSLYDVQIVQEPIYFSNHKESIAIYFTIKCTSKKSGKTITMPISEHFEVKDGKIISVRPFYYDTKAFAEFLQ